MGGEFPDEFWTKEFYSAADIGIKPPTRDRQMICSPIAITSILDEIKALQGEVALLKAMDRLSKAERNYLRRKILEEQTGNDESE